MIGSLAQLMNSLIHYVGYPADIMVMEAEANDDVLPLRGGSTLLEQLENRLDVDDAILGPANLDHEQPNKVRKRLR